MKEEPSVGEVCHSSVGDFRGRDLRRPTYLISLGPYNPKAQPYLQPADMGEILWGIQSKQERVKNWFAWALFKTTGCIRI